MSNNCLEPASQQDSGKDPPNYRQHAPYLLSTFYQIGQRRPQVGNLRSSNVFNESNHTQYKQSHMSTISVQM
eukprot:4903223-Ditylum_brightwellii.AAC.1